MSHSSIRRLLDSSLIWLEFTTCWLWIKTSVIWRIRLSFISLMLCINGRSDIKRIQVMITCLTVPLKCRIIFSSQWTIPSTDYSLTLRVVLKGPYMHLNVWICSQTSNVNGHRLPFQTLKKMWRYSWIENKVLNMKQPQSIFF